MARLATFSTTVPASPSGKHSKNTVDESELTSPVRTTVEICLAMIAACAHTLRSLFHSSFTNGTTASEHRGYHSHQTTHRNAPCANSTADQAPIEMGTTTAQGRSRSPGAESQESIVLHGEIQETTITKTTDFEVTISDGSSSETRHNGRLSYHKFWYPDKRVGI